MNIRKSLVFITALSATLSASMAMACDSSNMGTVDAIDGTFPVGGGTLITSLANAMDKAWMSFYATAGDAITVNYSEVGATISLVSGILREVNNGDVDVGDVLNVNDWNGNNQGSGGPDLVVQSTNNIASLCGPSNEWGDTCGPGTQSFTILTTGWHAIGTALCNSFVGVSGTITIALSGNTGPAPIPTLSTAAMLVLAALLALLGMAFVRHGRGFPEQLN